MVVMLAKKTQVLTIAVILSLVMVATAFGDTEKAKEFYNTGLKDKQAGKLDGAIISFKAAIATDADYADAYVQLGVIYFGQKDYKGALEALTSATEKAPTNAEAFANLGRVQIKFKKYEKAQAALKTAVSLAPDDLAAQLELCKAYYYGRLYAEAIGAATKLHDAGGGDHISWYMVGKSHQKTKAPNKAIPALKKSIGFKSSYYNAHSALGSIYLGQGKYKLAASAYKAAAKAKPSAYLASYNYAIAVHSGDSEDYATIIKVYEDFIKRHKKNPKAKTQVAQAQEIVKNSKDAQEEANLQ